VLSMMDSAPAGADVLASPAWRSAAHGVWGRPRATREGAAHARRHGRDDARAVPGARCARDARGAAAIAAGAVACDMVPSCAASNDSGDSSGTTPEPLAFARNPTRGGVQDSVEIAELLWTGMPQHETLARNKNDMSVSHTTSTSFPPPRRAWPA
jgi:hypothetical protein